MRGVRKGSLGPALFSSNLMHFLSASWMPDPMLNTTRDMVGTKVDKPELELIRARGKLGHSCQGEQHMQRP